MLNQNSTKHILLFLLPYIGQIVVLFLFMLNILQYLLFFPPLRLTSSLVAGFHALTSHPCINSPSSDEQLSGTQLYIYFLLLLWTQKRSEIWLSGASKFSEFCLSGTPKFSEIKFQFWHLIQRNLLHNLWSNMALDLLMSKNIYSSNSSEVAGSLY